MTDLGARDGAGAQGHLTPVVGELDRVGQQVVDDLLDLARICLDRIQFVG